MLYIHVPFCQSRCIYCDFYSTTAGADLRRRYVKALTAEICSRARELPALTLPTVYFGGGTPSMLTTDELAEVMNCIGRTFVLAPDAEVTLEANPDDITAGFARDLRRLGFNRMSLGVQTFDDRLLQTLRRRHTAAEAVSAVETLAAEGFDNISVDLIYGLPDQTPEAFAADLDRALSLPVTHLSAYALTVEEGTALDGLVRRGRLRPADEETCRAEYAHLMDRTAEAGFEHYEISNFARPGRRSRHNSGYWDGTPYLGCGPGAHSFDGETRRYDLPNLRRYVESAGDPPHEVEHLTKAEHFDEMLFTALRTREGLPLDRVADRFGADWLDRLVRESEGFRERGLMTITDGALRLTREGIFVSDSLISDLMRG